MARTIERALLFLGVCAMPLLTSCLGGGGGGSSSQQSLGNVNFLGQSVVQYDSTTAVVNVKGSLNITGATELNEINLYSDSQCLLDRVGFGIHRDFLDTGIDISIPSTAVTDIYLATNTSKGCFFLFSFVPKYDAPPAPVFRSLSPQSPSRDTFRPYISGEVSAATTNVRFYLDSACSIAAGLGTATQFESTGIQLTLIAETDNEIYALATDAFGKASECAFMARFLHDSNGPNPPVYIATSPVSPSGASTTPLIRGTVGTDIQTVTVYTDASCTMQTGTGTAEDFRTTGIQVTAAANGSTSYYAVATDDKMVPSDCTFLTIFTHDSVAPASPVFVATTPTSPTRTTLVPRISGTASADTQQIRIFNNSTCSNVVGSGTKAVFEGSGIPASIMANEITTLYGVASDAAGNMSACIALTTFEHDTIPPDPPVFGLSVPSSPNNQSTTPRIQGTTDITAVDVKLYNDESCTNLIGSGSTTAFDSPGIQVTVTGNTTTTLYATSDDTAGNTSECSALSNYSHSALPAPAPGFFQATPSTPTRITNRPYIVGTAANTITRVTIYSDSACTGSLGTASRSIFVTSGIQATVAVNAESSLYAISEDVYGNVSSCTFMTNYIHNTIPPLDPVLVSVTPVSPNNQSTTPVIRGSLTFDPGNVLQPNEVSLYDGFLCLNKIGTGTPADFQGPGIAASLPANTASSIYARVFDAAGNSSSCTFLTDYVHDALVPGRPLLASITPATPSYTSDTVMVGSIGTTTDFLPPTNLVVYTDSMCQTILKSAPVSQFTSGNYTLSVSKNSTTELYGAIFNQVGTASPCTLLVNYVHTDAAPTGLASIQGVDGSVALNWNPDTVARPIPQYEIRRSIQPGGPYTTVGEGIIGTTYTDYAVSNGQTYYYVVAARNITGVSKDSSEVARTVTVSTPNQILGLNAAPGPARVTLNWIGSSENMNYSIRRSTNPGGPYTTVAAGLSTTTHIDLSLANGTTYYYVIMGKNPAGQSVDSNQASATPLEVPPAPTNLQLTQVENSADCGGSFGVHLTWTPSPYFSSFSVNRGTNASSSTPIHSTTATSWTDCSPANDINGGGQIDYNYYNVTANWGPQQSGESNKVVFVNDGSGNIRTNPGNGIVEITWNSVTFASQYRLYRSTTPGGPYLLLDGAISSTTYLDTAVVNGQSYFYVMQAEFPSNSALGRATPEQGAIPGSNPEAASNLIVNVNSNRHPVLSWVSPHAFNYFRVYRAPAAGGPYVLVGTSNTNTYTDTSPIVGMNFYRVARMWGNAESSPTNTVQVRIGYPLIINITTTTTAANLTWSGVTGADSYTVYRSQSSGGPYAALDTTTAISYSDTSLVVNEGQFYVVRPNFADFSVGQYSNEVSGALSQSTIPTGLTVTGTTQSSVVLNWPRISEATSYKVYRSNAVDGAYTLVAQQASVGLTASALAGLTEHFFKYSFVQSGTESVASAAVSAFTWATPSAPVVTPGNNSINLSWGTVSGITSYSVERSTDGETFSTLASGLTLPQHNDTTAVNGALYLYRVVAVFPSGTRVSAASTAITPGLVPRTPTGLVITKNTSGSEVELSWGPVAGATFYRIYQSTSSGGPYTQASQTSTYSNNSVTGLSAGTKYYFVVAAVIGSLQSTYSNEVSTIPLTSPNAPIVSVTGANINVSWSAVSGASQYYVRRSTDRNNFATIAGPIAGTSYLDTSGAAGMSYSYRFHPIDAAGTYLAESLISADVSLAIAPTTPTNLLATATNTSSVSLTWTQVPNAVDYVISRSTTPGGPYSQVASVSATTYQDAGLTPGTTYYYVVSSRDFSGNVSSSSNEAAIRLGSEPTGLIATSMPNYIQLSWDSVGGATGYSVYRALQSGGPYGRVAQGLGANSYQDSNIQDGVPYFYVVRTEFGLELSHQSTEVNAIGNRRVDIQVPIELVDQSLSSDSIAKTFERTLTTFNTDHYDGAVVVYEFEAVVSNSDSTLRNVRLVDESDNVVGLLAVPAATSNRTRMRTVITPTLGNHRYRIQLDGTSSSGMLEVATARILVTQSGASRTAIYIPLLSSSAGAYIGDEDGPVFSTSSASYDSFSAASIYRREASKYAELVSQNPWTLETLVSATGNAVGAVSLYNNNLASHVDDTESLFTGQSIKLALSPFQDGVTGFSSANELNNYRIAIRCVAECQSGLVRIYKAGLWVHLRNLDKAQVIFRSSLGSMPSGLTHFDQQRSRIDLSKFSNPTVFFQSTAAITAGMDTGTIWLNDANTDDSETSGLIQVGTSELLVNSNERSLYRSPALTLNSDRRFIPSADPGTSMMQITDSAIVIDVTH